VAREEWPETRGQWLEGDAQGHPRFLLDREWVAPFRWHERRMATETDRAKAG